MTQSSEWQFDGIVGPTHNYAGLAHGNVASAKNAGAISNPRAAALQGIQKMRYVRDMGMKQAFLPPHPRPLVKLLQQCGFGEGTSRAAIAHTLESAAAHAPGLLASVFSSSFMWTANAATVSPSADTADGKLHLTPANLVSHFHRAIEAPFTTQLLRHIFADTQYFTVHDPLPATPLFSDEGAANHMRVQLPGSRVGTHVYVYGTEGGARGPQRYTARQHRVAFETIARQHGVRQAVYLQQSPEAIDAGVFHNDVIAMNTDGLMIAHETAFADPTAGQMLQQTLGKAFHLVMIPTAHLPVEDAVKSYVFNSQLLFVNGQYHLVAPRECEENPYAQQVIQSLLADGALENAHFLDVRESMRNGGGPACLRLRVRMAQAEAAAMHQGIIATETALQSLEDWVRRHYRDRLSFDDLRDPLLVAELEAAYAALGPLIGLSALYAV